MDDYELAKRIPTCRVSRAIHACDIALLESGRMTLSTAVKTRIFEKGGKTEDLQDLPPLVLEMLAREMK